MPLIPLTINVKVTTADSCFSNLFSNQLDCHFGCETCSGPNNGKCSVCLPGYFYLSNSTGGYCFLVCPFGYKPDYTIYQCVTELADVLKAGFNTIVAASPVTSTSFAIANAISGSFSLNIMMSIVATESLANMQYLNLNHSNIASTIYSAMSTSYIPNWIASFNTMERELLIFPWGIFQTNQISSLYLDNFGDSLTESMVHLGLYLLILAFTLTMQRKKLINSFAGAAHATVFGLFASNIFGKLQSQLLYSLLQILRMNAFSDTYSRMSLLTGYYTLSFSIGLLVFCFFKLLMIIHNKDNLKKNRSSISLSQESRSNLIIQTKWLEKKYEFLFDDFKSSQKNQFFFAYWISVFNAIYILLIFSLQSVPVLQCLSIVILILVFILFPATIKPFRKVVPAFLHFFNFSCVLIAAILNLGLAIKQNLSDDYSGNEIQGKFVISIISINTGINTLVSLSVMVFEIYKKCKGRTKNNKSKNERRLHILKR